MIDIRELRIGNHIMFNGTRVEVIGIEVSNDEDVPEVITVHEVLDTGEFDISCDPCELDPIPITEELLEELGFEKRGERFPYFGKDKIILEYKEEVGWYLLVGIMETQAFVKYLHELEAFVYLTTKHELI